MNSPVELLKDLCIRTNSEIKHLHGIIPVCEGGWAKDYVYPMISVSNTPSTLFYSIISKTTTIDDNDKVIFRSAEPYVRRFFDQACNGSFCETDLVGVSTINSLDFGSSYFKDLFYSFTRLNDYNFYISPNALKEIKEFYSKYWLGRILMSYKGSRCIEWPNCLALDNLLLFDRKLALLSPKIRDKIRSDLDELFASLYKTKYNTNHVPQNIKGALKLDSNMLYSVYSSNIDCYIEDEAALSDIVILINKIRRIIG